MAAEALRAHQTVFTDAHKIEFGKVVTREKVVDDGHPPPGRDLHAGRAARERDREHPDRVELTGADGSVKVFRGAQIPSEFRGDPLTLLARARDGEDGLKVVGEEEFRGQRVFLIDASSEIGTTRIAVSAETYLPVYAKLGLSTYVYDRVVTGRSPGR